MIFDKMGYYYKIAKNETFMPYVTIGFGDESGDSELFLLQQRLTGSECSEKPDLIDPFTVVHEGKVVFRLKDPTLVAIVMERTLKGAYNILTDPI